MSQLHCDPAEFEDRAIPRVRAWREADRLTPAPPKGWLHTVGLPLIPEGLSIGAWICAVRETQRYETGEDLGRGFHMIARDDHANRYLMVHPALRGFAANLVEEINDRMTGCSCGGSDCLAGTEQFRALQVRGKRVWDQLSPGRRMQAVKDFDGDPISVAVALSPLYFQSHRDDPDSPFDAWFLEHLIGAR